MPECDQLRTDVVGSLLRPAGLRETRAALEKGEIDTQAMRKAEDEAIAGAVRMQESVGLDVLTDGEYRRLNFQDSFGLAVEGYDAVASDLSAYQKRVEGAAPLQRWDIPKMGHTGTAVAHRRPVVEKLRLARNIPLDEYRFLSSIAKKPGKVSLIGPDRITQRFDYQASTKVYPTVDDFVADVVAIERQIIKSLVEAGCRYIHIDAPGMTAYVDPPSLDEMRR
ncbi:MAG TPA: hypothetical protein VG271_19565, partial [Beijerinckiaceae bacterium]|nr:hypothetical protein [Beijerinckiaceae bacterium]